MNSWYSSSKFYFEIIYQKRQVYRLNTLKACEKWIEVINASIIYGKFWSALIEKNPELYDWYWSQKETQETIQDNLEETNKIIKHDKTNNEENAEIKKLTNNTSSNISLESSATKKKERRKNPHSVINGNKSSNM